MGGKGAATPLRSGSGQRHTMACEHTSGGAMDCNAYGDCINACRSQADPTTCQNDCDAATTTSVRTAYEAIVTCANSDATTSAACQ